MISYMCLSTSPTYWAMHVLSAHVHNWPSMIDNGRKQTLWFYCNYMLCCCSLRYISADAAWGYVLYRALVYVTFVCKIFILEISIIFVHI